MVAVTTWHALCSSRWALRDPTDHIRAGARAISTQLMDKTVITHLFSTAPDTVCAMISVKSSNHVGINVMNTMEGKAFFAGDGTGDMDRFVMPSTPATARRLLLRRYTASS